jgi:hypothetical protein
MCETFLIPFRVGNATDTAAAWNLNEDVRRAGAKEL